MEALLLSNERVENEETLAKKNSDDIPIDLSYDLQWMSNNYENLDKDQKEIFDRLNNLYVKEEKNISFINRIIKKAYADEECYSEIDDNVKLFSRELIYQTFYQPIVLY